LLLSAERVASSCPVSIERISAGTNFAKRREAPAAVEKIFAELCDPIPGLICASANGTFIDAAERTAIEKHSPDAQVYSIKVALGESVGARSLWQTFVAVQALMKQN